MRKVWRWRRIVVLLATLAAVLLTALSASASGVAQTNSPLKVSVRVGFDGIYKSGTWIPVRVMLENEGPDVEVVVQTSPSRSGSEINYSRTVTLPTQSRKEVFIYVPAEGFIRRLTVEVMVEGTLVAEVETRLDEADAADLVYGVWAGSPSAFTRFNDIDPLNGVSWVAQLEVADLPVVSAAWQTLDVLMISDVDTATLSAAQREALQAWVLRGGRLIVASGPGWQKTTAGLADILPVSVGGTTTLSDFQDISAYAYAKTTLQGEALLATLTPAAGSDTLLQVQGVPLIVEQRMGYGYVNVLAFDPALSPFRSWDGMENVYRNLFASTAQRPSWSFGARNWSNAGDAVNAIPGLALPSVLLICSFLAVYIMVVGPLNYFILRFLKRRVLAWATIPVLVVIFSASAYIVGFSSRGNRPIVHSLMVIESWENSDQAVINGLVGVFSPRRASYDVTLTGNLLARPLPTDRYYGSANTIEGVRLTQGDVPRVEDIRVDVAEVKSFVIRGQTSAPQFVSNLIFEVTGSSATLVGTVTNLSDITLEDAVILTGGGVERLGNIAPGDTRSVNLNMNINRAAPANLYNYLQVAPPSLTGGPRLPSGTALLSSAGPYGYDSTVDDILGHVPYYDDRAIYRRYSLLTWLMDPYNSGGRGNWTFLAGWSNDAPVAVEIVNSSFNSEDLVLHMINLDPQLVIDEHRVVVPPGLMTWEVLDPGTFGNISPYDAYLYQGYYALHFQPQLDLNVSRVDSLTMHAYSYGSTGNIPGDIIFSLWDHEAGAWVELQSPVWGDNLINEAARFVGANGGIDVRIDVSGSQVTSYNLEKLDFTLVVER